MVAVVLLFLQSSQVSTLIPRIIAHVRKRFFGKKFPLCGLKWDLCILIKIRGQTFKRLNFGAFSSPGL